MQNKNNYGVAGAAMVFVILITLAGICLPAALCHGEPVNAPYYGLKNKISLSGKTFNFLVTDKRREVGRMECSDCAPVHTTEFVDAPGFEYFTNYLKKMTEEASGQVGSSGETITIELEVLNPRIFGFGFRRVHGLAQFNVKSNTLNKRYCSDMKDGDDDAPFGKSSFNWTSGSAMRKMMSGSLSKVLEQFLADLEKNASGTPAQAENKIQGN